MPGQSPPWTEAGAPGSSRPAEAGSWEDARAPTTHHGPPGARGAKPGLSLPVATEGDTPVHREEIKVSFFKSLLTFLESQTPLEGSKPRNLGPERAVPRGSQAPISGSRPARQRGPRTEQRPGTLALQQAGVHSRPGAPATYPTPLHWLARRGGGSGRGGVVLPGRRPALRLKYARPGTPLPGRGRHPGRPRPLRAN